MRVLWAAVRIGCRGEALNLRLELLLLELLQSSSKLCGLTLLLGKAAITVVNLAELIKISVPRHGLRNIERYPVLLSDLSEQLHLLVKRAIAQSPFDARIAFQSLIRAQIRGGENLMNFLGGLDQRFSCFAELAKLLGRSSEGGITCC